MVHSNYSYRALLVTSLLFGILFLLLYSWKLGRVEVVEEPVYDIEYAQEIQEPKQEIAEIVTPNIASKVKTNRAYNEAAKFISRAENLRVEPTETTDGKLSEMNEAISETTEPGYSDGLDAARQRLEKAKQKISNGTQQNTTATITQSGSRQTTMSYRLVGRSEKHLPNPVYICEGSGKIVINITVDANGAVTNADYNRSSSTTTNGCLIDSALEYALAARFTTASEKPRQLGTITYNFPGQQ
ncbi:MAG: hypothetical protein CMC08_09055 [Flavobacteriaceae bacterium]|mgnify:CR=1 FL=1|nr:hypothetical protein [Flavobacteriaceae bacterium]